MKHYRLPHHHPPLGSNLKRLNPSVIDSLELLAKKVNVKLEKLGQEGEATTEDMFYHQTAWMGWLYDLD